MAKINQETKLTKPLSPIKKPRVIYKGFSTKLWEQQGKGFTLTDVEIVKEDLLNHIFTSKGERVGMPEFGTRIPELAFEPLDASTIGIVEEDLRMVFDYDPRVQILLLDVKALPNNNAIVAFCRLQYIELNVEGDLRIEVPIGGN